MLWLYCRAREADHGIYVPSLEVCEAMGPAVAAELRTMGESPVTWVCDYAEVPIPENMCYP